MTYDPIENLVPKIVRSLLTSKTSIGVTAWDTDQHWLAFMVVALVEERAKFRFSEYIENNALFQPAERHWRMLTLQSSQYWIRKSVSEFNIILEDWEWLKEKIGE